MTQENGFAQRPEAPKILVPNETGFDRLEAIARDVVDCAFKLHDDLGPGLLESAYEIFLAASLRERGLLVEQQRPIAVTYKGIQLREAFRADLLVEDLLLVEIKSIDRLAPIHSKQLLTYVRLTGSPLGLLVNFGGMLLKDGVKRIINDRTNYRAPSR